MQLECHKRRLAEAVRQIEDYIECFRQMDLDKCGKIAQKVMQSYLMYFLIEIDRRNTIINPRLSADFITNIPTKRDTLSMRTCLKH